MVNKAKRNYFINRKSLSYKIKNIITIHRGSFNTRTQATAQRGREKACREGYYLMVVPCKRSIFLLSSAMMLWSSVMRSSYRSVVRSWTSSCSLMRWDCSHWNQENKKCQ